MPRRCMEWKILGHRDRRIPRYRILLGKTASVFWNSKGVMLVDCMKQGAAVIAGAYCTKLEWLRAAIECNTLLCLRRSLLQHNARLRRVRLLLNDEQRY